jgi:hypothetical protein
MLYPRFMLLGLNRSERKRGPAASGKKQSKQGEHSPFAGQPHYQQNNTGYCRNATNTVKKESVRLIEVGVLGSHQTARRTFGKFRFNRPCFLNIHIGRHCKQKLLIGFRRKNKNCLYSRLDELYPFAVPYELTTSKREEMCEGFAIPALLYQ